MSTAGTHFNGGLAPLSIAGTHFSGVMLPQKIFKIYYLSLPQIASDFEHTSSSLNIYCQNTGITTKFSDNFNTVLWYS